MKLTLKCFQCKQEFPRDEIVKYAAPGTKTYQNYCPKCLEEKKKRETFTKVVCGIFGIKAPGGRIWSDRKRLIEVYGYTDEIICDALEYLYNVKNVKKLSESLVMITPTVVDEMMRYKREKGTQKNILENLMNKEYKYEIIKVRENEDNDPDLYNLDDLL